MPFAKKFSNNAHAAILLLNITKSDAELREDLQQKLRLLDRETNCSKDMKTFVYGIHRDKRKNRACSDDASLRTALRDGFAAEFIKTIEVTKH